MKQFIKKSKALYGKILDEYRRDFPNDTKTISTYEQWLNEILDIREEDTDITMDMVTHELKDWFRGLESSHWDFQKGYKMKTKLIILCVKCGRKLRHSPNLPCY